MSGWGKARLAVGGVLLLAGWALALSGGFRPLTAVVTTVALVATVVYLLVLVRAGRRRAPKVGAQALEDRGVLNRIGGELRDGVATLEQAAGRVRVEPPMLAAALQRAHGVVPAVALHRRARARRWR